MQVDIRFRYGFRFSSLRHSPCFHIVEAQFEAVGGVAVAGVLLHRRPLDARFQAGAVHALVVHIALEDFRRSANKAERQFSRNYPP